MAPEPQGPVTVLRTPLVLAEPLFLAEWVSHFEGGRVAAEWRETCERGHKAPRDWYLCRKDGLYAGDQAGGSMPCFRNQVMASRIASSMGPGA